ncbi:AtpZ/AtpI family protein [Bacillus sp. FJAT-42315]|uniref:AtpZ/AtpI family protein n=1 Tax=Bacillus sp. FJAT-42315 TaxID=2014077 RepID=UPI001E56E801|nr:AtpZ/AtpI family protein [Bacillus sp. FJAT-42315]
MKNRKSPFRAMALYSSILAQLTASILIGIFAGRWLDGKWNTDPLCLIIGLLLGLTIGIFLMLQSVRYFNSGD